MHHVWELRVHPSQRFSAAWLAAVDRWALNMASQQQQQQGLAMPPPPPPPRSQPAAAAAGAAPVPAEPAEVHDDDYEFDSEETDSDYEDAAEQEQAAAGGSGDSDDSDASEDDAYDMVSYLNRMTLQDDSAAAAAGDDDNDSQHSADDNISTAATAGSSVAGSRRPRWGRNGGSSSSKPRSAAGGSAAAAARAAGMADDSAAGGSGELDDDSGSGSWETDSEAAEGDDDAEQQQAQGEAPAAAAAAAVGQGDEGSSEEEQEGSSDKSDTAAMDTALTAAEEKDLLGEYQHEEQEEAAAASAAAGVGSQRPPKQRRGERKRERWQAQQQAQLLVSLRLEKQGLTDKEARVIASWYASSAGAQRLGFAKLWLFDNSLGDGAAAALAPLIGPTTTEIHLSHNQISAAGAKALLGAVPLQRARGAKPLWLRVEWNQIDEAELRRYIQQDCAARKLVVDIAKELPVEQRTRTDSRGRELNLVCVASGTCLTMKLLQALAGSGRFGRGLAPEQQTFIVLADTVLKQLDSCKAAEAGVGGPVRRFLDRGLDEAGPKGLDFLTVLAAHEGEGLVVDRQAAVAGSRSPAFAGSSGQRSDLAIIEVALFFRTELLAAAAAAVAEATAAASGASEEAAAAAAPCTPTRQQQAAAAAAAEAQPVILVTNDNAQLQLAKAHGLPAFKLAGAAGFEASLGELIKGGADLSSRQLRQLMAPAATAGLGAVAGRSLQDDFDGAVCCTRGLLDAYQDLSGLLARVSMLAAGAGPGEEPAALQELRQLLQDHQHTAPFESSPSGGGCTPAAAAAGGCDSGSSVLEVAQSNIAALERSLEGWEARVRGRHTPSRVLKWASSTGRTPAGPR
ncbi:hypothetical protein OEZ86_007728 [Tetradesmus obliquus]|nr:hypothetical protein OEZ86_007728 [Tetradesmus obliquus]